MSHHYAHAGCNYPPTIGTLVWLKTWICKTPTFKWRKYIIPISAFPLQFLKMLFLDKWLQDTDLTKSPYLLTSKVLSGFTRDCLLIAEKSYQHAQSISETVLLKHIVLAWMQEASQRLFYSNTLSWHGCRKHLRDWSPQTHCPGMDAGSISETGLLKHIALAWMQEASQRPVSSNTLPWHGCRKHIKLSRVQRISFCAFHPFCIKMLKKPNIAYNFSLSHLFHMESCIILPTLLPLL